MLPLPYCKDFYIVLWLIIISIYSRVKKDLHLQSLITLRIKQMNVFYHNHLPQHPSFVEGQTVAGRNEALMQPPLRYHVHPVILLVQHVHYLGEKHSFTFENIIFKRQTFKVQTLIFKVICLRFTSSYLGNMKQKYFL